MNKCSRFSGGCGCGEARYGLRNPPLFVHACHCIDCQKASGSAFRITTIVLERDIVINQGDVSVRKISTKRTEFICKSCGDVIYRTATNHPETALLNSRTLDNLRVLEIGAHIWTVDKHAWLKLPADVPQFENGRQERRVASREPGPFASSLGDNGLNAKSKINGEHPVQFRIESLTQSDAETIATWHYDGEYAFYDAEADAEDLADSGKLNAI